MANFRSQFVDSAATALDADSLFSANHYSSAAPHDPNLFHRYPAHFGGSDHSLPPPPPPPPKHGASDVQLDHELSNLADPFRDQRPNPFDLEESPAAPYAYSRYPEGATDSSELNRATDPTDRFGELSGEKDTQDWQRRNERNRIKLQRRLPRYHFTKLPWFTMLATVIQVAVFIVELAKMGKLTGSPIMTKPYFNPMIGPSPYLLINMGARYVPCMHRLTNITLDTTINYPCPNSTSSANSVCNLSELCGLGGVPIVDDEFAPDQWYRVVTPIFLHAGFLHITFNMLLQLTMGASVERQIGWLKYGVIYMASGIAGFLLGANFSPDGVASTGASGSLFGIIAANLLLFVYSGTKNTNMYGTSRYKLFVAILVGEVLVSIVLGLLPGLDNFSHIGGFCMGLLLSVVLLPDPSHVYVDGIYTYEPDTRTLQLFFNNWNPVSKWDHKVQWKALLWLLLRVVCLALAALFFALLFRNLYSKDMQDESNKCSWCKYINCLPVHDWCDQGEISVTTESDSSSSSSSSATATALSLPTSINNPDSKRDMFAIFHQDTLSSGADTLRQPPYLLLVGMVVVGALLVWRRKVRRA